MHHVASSAATWKPVGINGGGYVTGMDIAADGTMVSRVDVFGAYLNTLEPPVAWTLLTTTASLPASAWGFTGANYTGNYITPVGVYEIRIAPTNTSIFYMMMNAKMYFTANRGTTWTLMNNFPSITWAANENDSYRTYQKKIGIDPANADVVYIGTPSNGLYVTSNGTSGAAATFAAVGTVLAAAGQGLSAIVFDPASGTTGGKTNKIYATSYGHGVYTSANAGTSWALIASSPTTVFDAIVVGGNLYCATTAGIQEWNGSTWTTTVADGGGVSTLTINPFNSSWFACMGNGGGNLNQNTGAGWQGPYYQAGLNPNNPPSDTPWLADTKPGYPTYASQTGNNFSASACWFDPVHANRFWIAWGYGVAYIDLTTPAVGGSTPMTFISACEGIQDTVATCAISEPGGYPFVAMEDVQFFRITNTPDVSPVSSAHGTGTSMYAARVQLAGWSMDYSQSTPGVVAALVYWNGQNASAYATDYGLTWTQFPTAPTAHNGGCITCVDATHFVAIDANGTAAPVHSADGGNTWTATTGLPATGWPNNLFNNPQILCNDAAGIVYGYSNANGLYSSSDRGATFTLVNSQNLMTGSWGTTGYDNPKLSAVPGNAGFLFFGPGYTNSPFPQTATFWKSTNGGVAWSAVPNVYDVWCHGYGQPYATYPTLWIVGWVKVGAAPYLYGIWRSRDLGVSDWVRVADFPSGLYDQPRCISGDAGKYSTCYVGFQGSSYMYGINLP